MKSSFSSSPHHEKFEELAALAAVGELGALELEYLRRHLGECLECRQAYKTFADLTSNELGVVGAGRQSLEVEYVSLGDTDEGESRKHLARLRNHLESDDSTSPSRLRGTRVHDNMRDKRPVRRARRAVVCSLVAALLVTVGVAGGISIWRTTRALSAERARAGELEAALHGLQQQRGEKPSVDSAVLRSLKESQQRRDALQRSLSAVEAENQDLLARERASEEKVATAIANAQELKRKLETSEGDKERAAKLEAEANAKLMEALVELYQTRQANSEVAKQGQTSEGVNVASVSETATPTEADARNLFGARDLHIVDVYDVSGDGATKRTYGRVYYVEKKLLVFYAFDLQNRRGRKQGVFQAWGYREPDVRKPVSLGLFSVDDSSVQRWALTVNRADVLSHIDAVFVTVEPPGGSAAPRGKKVLYANLVGPPNHP